MSKIDEALEQLIQTILESEEYVEFDKQRNEVNKFPKLKEKLDEFRLRNFELQTSEELGFEQIDQLENEYKDLRDNILVSDFLAAELAFCRLMQNINRRMTEAVDFE